MYTVYMFNVHCIDIIPELYIRSKYNVYMLYLPYMYVISTLYTLSTYTVCMLHLLCIHVIRIPCIHFIVLCTLYTSLVRYNQYTSQFILTDGVVCRGM